jgi:hypothetical protein
MGKYADYRGDSNDTRGSVFVEAHGDKASPY